YWSLISARHRAHRGGVESGPMLHQAEQARPYVLLSCTSADRKKALQVADLLEASGISVWLDRKSIAGGTSWSGEIVERIKGCVALVLLVSQAAVTSPNVQ